MALEVVALDIDDVVVRHVEGFVAWSNATWGTRLTPDDYSEAWHELWGIDPDEVEKRKRAFFTDDIIGNFAVMEGAAEGLAELSAMAKVVGVTARRESLRQVTETTLDAIAPGAVSDVVFATSFRDGEKVTRTKADICQEIGATHLIDDQLKHCIGVTGVGLRAVLFGDWPWNRTTEELPPGIIRTTDWPETVKYFTGEQNATSST